MSAATAPVKKANDIISEKDEIPIANIEVVPNENNVKRIPYSYIPIKNFKEIILAYFNA